MKRKALSKRTRFEVFKRDNFTCKYCGKGITQNAILQVDHIIPVSKGGDDSLLNLITSCIDCNLGKSNKDLNNITVMTDIKNINDQFKQYKEQVKQYFEYINEKNDTNEKLIDLIHEKISYRDRDKHSINYFIKKLPYDEILDATDIALSKFGNTYKSERFKYFCGICHSKIKNKPKMTNL